MFQGVGQSQILDFLVFWEKYLEGGVYLFIYLLLERLDLM